MRKGVGPVKAAALVGAFQLGRRATHPANDAVVLRSVRVPEVFVHPFRSISYTDSGVFVQQQEVA